MNFCFFFSENENISIFVQFFVHYCDFVQMDNNE